MEGRGDQSGHKSRDQEEALRLGGRQLGGSGSGTRRRGEAVAGPGPGPTSGSEATPHRSWNKLESPTQLSLQQPSQAPRREEGSGLFPCSGDGAPGGDTSCGSIHGQGRAQAPVKAPKQRSLPRPGCARQRPAAESSPCSKGSVWRRCDSTDPEVTGVKPELTGGETKRQDGELPQELPGMAPAGTGTGTGTGQAAEKHQGREPRV